MMFESYVFELIIFVGVVVSLYFFFQWFCKCNPNEKQTRYLYSYSDNNGPHTWKYRFRIMGSKQSPINILSICATRINAKSVALLDFSAEYHTSPADMKIVNDGYTVAIYPSWRNGRKPIVCGGPLCDEYKLFCLRFRWGPNDEEGSEHMIDMRRYCMELQVTYNKCSCKCIDMEKSTRTCAVLIISYVFEVTEMNNPYFETIIEGLQYIRFPCKNVSIRPFPVSLIAPMFNRVYFTYIGSLTYPPCTEGVRWIVNPEPLTISSIQIQEFRKLIGYNGRIQTNTRPVQNSNNRDVLMYM